MKQGQRLLLLCAVVAVICFLSVRAVKFGDEKYGFEKDGFFYAFLSGRIHVINPFSLTTIKVINDSDLPTSWGDVVYAENGDHQHFAFAADRTFNRLFVLDTVTHSIIAKVPVGPNPVHIYTIEDLGQIWSHSDGEGNFDVIDYRKNVCTTFSENLGQANSQAHGKLLFEDDLKSIAFATNTRDMGVFRFNLTDLATPQATFINLTSKALSDLNSDRVCTGTHGIAYSSVNKHLYVECSGGRGTWEYDTVNDKLVAIYPTVLGQLYATPDDTFVLAVNSASGFVHVFEADLTGSASNQSVNYPISKPSRPAFVPVGSSSSTTFEDWIGFISTTNTTSAYGLAYLDFALAAQGNYVVNYIDAGFSSATRIIKYGGGLLGLNTETPSRSLALVNASTQTLVGYVPFDTTAAFSRLLWVPKRTLTNLTSCFATPAPTLSPTTSAPTLSPTTAAPVAVTLAPTAAGNSTNAAFSFQIDFWLLIAFTFASLVLTIG